MQMPWQAGRPLSPEVFEEVRLKTIFECFKWDPQVGDVSILADFPLILDPGEWQKLCKLAEQLAAETIAAENELLHRPALHSRLGLPRQILNLLKHRSQSNPRDVRVIRFDFHLTTEGWRISEANSDVPGGFNEASGFTRLMQAHYPQAVIAGDPTQALAQAIRAVLESNSLVALVHATAYTDDRQVMLFLEQHLNQLGLRTILVAPDHLKWEGDRVFARTTRHLEPVDFVYRFFPAEWLPNLRRAGHWQDFFVNTGIPSCNPGSALLTQTKRFPLVWDSLETPLTTWRALLPETRDPSDIHSAGREDQEWVFKPALGRVGEGIGMYNISEDKEWKSIRRQARRYSKHWVAQRRFEPLAMLVGDASWYPCIGVYTVNGRAVGVYARANDKPLIAATAKDFAVLINEEQS